MNNLIDYPFATGPGQGGSSQYSQYQQGQSQQYSSYRSSQGSPGAQTQRPYTYEQVHGLRSDLVIATLTNTQLTYGKICINHKIKYFGWKFTVNGLLLNNKNSVSF